MAEIVGLLRVICSLPREPRTRMTKNARPRHAAQSRVSRIAGRAALGVLGAPMAMLAIAGPAGAAEAHLADPVSDDEVAGTDAAFEAFDASTLPGLAAAELSAL